MVSLRAEVLTGCQRQTDAAPLLEVRESERREASGICTLAKGAAYQQGPLLGFGGFMPNENPVASFFHLDESLLGV